VEFRYWDVPLDSSDSHNLMDASKLATAYALFYLDGHRLKVDYGPYPPGAVPAGGGAKNTTDVTTVVLADNAEVDGSVGPFSHNTVANAGQGSVRLNVMSIPPPEVEACNVNRSKRIVWEPPAAAVNRTSSSGPAGDPPVPAAGGIPESPSRLDPPWTQSTHGPRNARP